MPWRFDAQSVDIVFVIDTSVPVESGLIVFGEEIGSDLIVDTGVRDNDSSIVDSGLRIIDGSF
jgi:hypothetical protein